MHLGSTVTLLAMSLVAAIGCAFLSPGSCRTSRISNRLVLQPPATSTTAIPICRPPPTCRPSLLGAIGVAVTTLRPSGKAQFGDEFLDVIAEGDYVNPGSRVQVIEIEGNRIVVKEV